MADSRGFSSKKKLVVRLERYRRKQVSYFDDKSMVDEFRYDIGSLVRRECSTEFESWKIVHEELKKSMSGELSVHWDVDETEEKQRKYMDELFKQSFRQWKFDMLQGMWSELLLPQRRRIEVEL
ncbi:hypothetical protein D8674_021787 [Pyrus ussuriensis x Pyrus communis]|uniref:Uncharacterized protein n=1 Tax=Pyrus ussuriensis x Pyrus communis TaxID=2448454 RepID=A0A5N5GI39_9ROSA|nr:hypothetical protein D8674_021787 [Pyrus ussuriensis x Pyrus communis]